MFRITTALGVGCLSVCLAGCGNEPQVLSRPGDSPAPATAANPDEIKLTPIVGAKTTEVRDAQAEMAAGAQESAGRITAKDPITIQGNAYVVAIGKIAQLQITDALRKFEAINERFPADLDEFMREIIQANGIALPQLPYYQEYGYDAEQHSLVILEYPDRKEAFQKQQDTRLGRD